MNEEDESEDFIFDADFMFKLLPDIVKCGLAKGLKSNTQIRSLSLTRMGLRDDFAFALAESLVENTTLEAINLSENNFSAVGIQVLIEALSVNRSVQTFMVSSSLVSDQPISSEDEVFMVNRLKENIVLVKASIPLISVEAISMLESIIQRNCLQKFQKWKA